MSADRLSLQGRAQAVEVGRSLAGGYAVVFVSPARRAAETAVGFLTGAGEPDAELEVISGLGGDGTDGSPVQLGAVVAGLLARIPEGARGLAVGHTPLIEKATEGLTGRVVEPLGECEGVLLTEDGGELRTEELRLHGEG